MPAVKELAETDRADLVGGRGAPAEEAVELLHQLAVAAVLGDGAHQYLQGGEASIEYRENPHIVQHSHPIQQRPEEDPDNVVKMPYFERTSQYFLHQLQLIGWLDLIDVLIVVA